MAQNKYCAVAKGRNTDIFNTWNECKANVTGYPGATYKGFPSLESAAIWLNDMTKDTDDNDTEESYPDPDSYIPPKGTLIAFVDGSCHGDTGYAFGCLFLLPDGRKFEQYGGGADDDRRIMRNVAGETIAAAHAAQTALENDFQTLELYYDYEGIEKWPTNVWQTNNDMTACYKIAMQAAMRCITINFHKVKGHTDVKGNEIADRLAKQGLELRTIPPVLRFDQIPIQTDPS